MQTNTGLLLEHFCRLAANDAGTSAGVVAVFSHRKGRGPRQAAHGLSREQTATVAEIDGVLAAEPGLTVIPDLSVDPRFAAKGTIFGCCGLRFVVHINLLSSVGERVGFICLLDEMPRQGLTDAQIASLGHIAAMTIADRRREQRHQHLMHVADRALRVDRMQRVVSDAASCADALAALLEELSVFHGAAIGRIWQLNRSNEPLLEVGRYRTADAATSQGPLGDPLTREREMAAAVIRRNRPDAVSATASEAAEGASGPLGYVCVPIWVHQKRFGLSLVFSTEDQDLDLVVADICSLADTIRPALFRKATEDRIRFAAHHDDLTQLSNRLMFQERLQQALASARSGGHGFALFYLDLDGFKQVNDTHGHEMGDKLLVSVAQRLRDSVREADTVARMGGDEFAIIQQFGGDPASASALAERLLETIAEPFEPGERRSPVGVSIGIAFYPQHGETPDLLLRNADIALYRAKKSGRNTFRLFSPDMEAAKPERPLTEQDLQEAMTGRRFTLAYQPVCDCKSSRILGFEALLRWDDPLMGPIQPDRFIPLAETSGLIIPLGHWVLETACAEAASWASPATLSVNLSPVQFSQHDLVQQIAEILHRTGLPATRLELEVTEGLLLDDTDLVLRTMHGLRALGIRMVLDDFGTAYASLSYLRRFPFDSIKIDRSFIRDMCDVATTLTIVESILALGNRLNLAVIAEGVETERQREVLRNLGCRFVQGYLTGKPCKSDQARALLRQPSSQGKPEPARSSDRHASATTGHPPPA